MSYTGFRLGQKLVTLNDLERRNDRRRAISLRQLSFLYKYTVCYATCLIAESVYRLALCTA